MDGQGKQSKGAKGILIRHRPDIILVARRRKTSGGRECASHRTTPPQRLRLQKSDDERR
jgi:hypothetical protein